MRVLQTLISNYGFRDRATNGLRTQAFDNLLDRSASLGCESVLLPAGYWTARDMAERDALIAQAASRARSKRIAVSAGVDVGNFDKLAVTDDMVAVGTLPYFAFAVDETGQTFGPWRQLSTTGANAHLAGPLPLAERTVLLAGQPVVHIICGEIFSEVIAEQVSAAGADDVFVLGHAGMGQGLIGAMRRMSRAGAWVLHTHHVSDNTDSTHAVDPTGGQQSRSIGNDYQYLPTRHDRFWVGWSVRDC